MPTPSIAAAERQTAADAASAAAGSAPGLAAIEENPSLYAEAFPAAQPVNAPDELGSKAGSATGSRMPALPRTAVHERKAEPIMIPVVNVPLPTVVSEWIRSVLPNPDEPMKLEDLAIILAALAAAVIASMTTMAVATGMIGRSGLKHVAWRVSGRRYRPGYEWPMEAAAQEDAARRPAGARPPHLAEVPPLRKAG